MMTEDSRKLPAGVADVIRELIKSPNVQSVSFPFFDEEVWRMLVAEQIDRARRTGLHLQHAFGLAGPDDGLPFNTAAWGGYVHVPFEGMCQGDLLVKPDWRAIDLRAALGEGDLTAAMHGKACHYLLLKGIHREVDSAVRTLADGWTLYTSKRAYSPASPFLDWKFEPGEPLPIPDPEPY